MSRKQVKAHITTPTKLTEDKSAQSWYCYEHRCWNSKRQRYCLCKKPEGTS